ncbi:MAG: guanine deaminase [Thermococci archaeon]|nr:guanine deaminase [Thermococci archaeon]
MVTELTDRVTYCGRIITFEGDASGSLRVREARYMTVEGGRIVEISNDRPSGDLVDYSDHVILPGFIDTHVHLPQLHERARISDSLLEWLERYIFPAEMRFSDPDYAEKVSREFFAELVSKGTTTAVVFSSSHEEATDVALRVAAETGLRAVIGQVLMDRNGPEELLTTPEEAGPSIRRLAERWHGYGGRLYYAVTPRFAVSCSMELMKTAGALAREMGLYVQTHLSEQVEEVETVRRLFPDVPTYTEVYDRAGLLGPRTLVAHAIHLSDRERRLLKRRGSSIAHCPSSNFFLHSGVMNLRRHLSFGLNVALGSDVAAGPFTSMLDVLRDAYYANFMRPEEAFYMLTMGGARALGMDDIIGSLERGKQADFVVVKPTTVSDSDDTTEVLSSLMILGGDVKATYVAGRRLWEAA